MANTLNENAVVPDSKPPRAAPAKESFSERGADERIRLQVQITTKPFEEVKDSGLPQVFPCR